MNGIAWQSLEAFHIFQTRIDEAESCWIIEFSGNSPVLNCLCCLQHFLVLDWFCVCCQQCANLTLWQLVQKQPLNRFAMWTTTRDRFLCERLIRTRIRIHLRYFLSFDAANFDMGRYCHNTIHRLTSILCLMAIIFGCFVIPNKQ